MDAQRAGICSPLSFELGIDLNVLLLTVCVCVCVCVFTSAWLTSYIFGDDLHKVCCTYAADCSSWTSKSTVAGLQDLLDILAIEYSQHITLLS